jgi:anti-sigma B factor antagonist
MDVTFETSGPATIISVRGELDASNVGDFKRQVTPRLETNVKVLFDMSLLRFIDSSGLGAMISCLRHTVASGGELKICCVSKQVMALFELVRMNRVFDIHTTREEALKAFGQGAGAQAGGH